MGNSRRLSKQREGYQQVMKNMLLSEGVENILRRNIETELISCRDILSNEINYYMKKIIAQGHKNYKDFERYKSAMKSYSASISLVSDDDILRFKDNSRFKGMDSTGFIKRLFNGKRYERERMNAAKVFAESGPYVKASVGKQKVADNIENAENIEIIFQSLKNKESDLAKIKNALASKNKARNDAKRGYTDEQSGELKTFFTIYQSNYGAKKLNVMAREKYLSTRKKTSMLVSSDVIEEYNSRLGFEIFSKESGKTIKDSIKSMCTSLNSSLDKFIDLLYNQNGGKELVVFRGQGMTIRGYKQIEKFAIYQAGQFFSTSTIKNVAKRFALNSRDDIKVIFEITGYSGRALITHTGFTFGDREGEILFSPLSCFRVVDITSYRDYKVIKMEEVKKPNGKIDVMPY